MSGVTRYRKAAHTRRVGAPFNAFRSLLGLSVAAESPTYAELYDGDWTHPGTTSGDVG